MATSRVEEIPPSTGPDGEQIRSFRLLASGVSVELCSLGASVTRLLLPSHAAAVDRAVGSSPKPDSGVVDDCVLGYGSPVEMMSSGNPMYLGVLVGRVANRIKRGEFRLKQRRSRDADGEGKEQEEVVLYNLETNNGPNHLHGGAEGFSGLIWEAESVETMWRRDEGEAGGKDSAPTSAPGVSFSLISEDGDQGYPGRVRISATYSLRPGVCGGGTDAVLRLDIRASMLSPDVSSPVNLAQHSYFNLGSHSSTDGILDHVLSTPDCAAYLPVDGTSIPTREVRSVEQDPVMDFRDGKILREALARYGRERAGRTDEEADEDVRTRRLPAGVEPYGIDHCYVVGGGGRSEPQPIRRDGLRLAGRVEHPRTQRRMEVWTDAPGVQIYSANFLDGTCPGPGAAKDGAEYGMWQGICLETQSYPDSILLNDEDDGEFAAGRCFVLTPGGEDYVHKVEYVFGETMTP